jgi:NitT/TauT family transport system substrate-binding protein
MVGSVTVALDWTPNTNHAGFYLAREAGHYEAAGVDVSFVSPAADDYETTPAKRVASGDADLAVAPSESAISYHTHPTYPSLTAVAAVCQRDTSAIAVLASSDVARPRDLDGRTYASYDARFEDDIVRQLIRNDGGEGDVNIVTPPKLGIPNTIVDGSADATWVFEPWEGLLAERAGHALRTFGLDEYDVPYGYTPVLLAHPDALADPDGRLAAFLDATARGYREAAADPERAADALHGEAGPNLDDREFLVESARRLSGAFLTDDGSWGEMDHERWVTFVDWLTENEILRTLEGDSLPASELDAGALYTNDLLP